VKRFLLTEMGGSRLALYSAIPVVAALLLCLFYVLPVRTDDQPGRESLARTIAMHHRLTRMQAASAAAMRSAVAKAFSDGQALAAKVTPTVVLHGTTPVHTEQGPPEVGPIEIRNTLNAAIVTIPATGDPYARADITTYIALPKLSFSRSFTETVSLDSATFLDERPPCKPAPGLPPLVTLATSPAVRTLIGVDAGLVIGSSSANYEIGFRVYPAATALSLKYAEARTGFYGRIDSDGRAALGVSIVIGLGKGK
jgi:hypothetical protein